MGQNQTVNIALTLFLLGALSFTFGVIAENKKPPFGVPVKKGEVIICNYPSDPTIAYGSMAVVTLLMSAGVGVLAVFYPYNGKKVPTDALFSNTTLLVFLTISIGMTVLAGFMLMWAIVSEGLHLAHNVHYDPDAECTTAKTGLFGGAAFVAFDATLFWLICQMLALNAREDYLEEEEDPKGDYGQVLASEL